MPIMWCLANPELGEHSVLAALLDHNHHLIRDGQVLLADKGFAGKEFKKLTEAIGLRLQRPDREDETTPGFGREYRWYVCALTGHAQ